MNEMPDTMILADLERERWESDIERAKAMRDSRKTRRGMRASYEERLQERFKRSRP